MTEAYERRLTELRREIEMGGARPAIIDTAVNELLADGDERLPSNLLSLLSDNAEYDEGMFSLIHAAESYDDSVYVHALLSVFASLASAAPRWASIVLMRVLNDSNAQLEMVRQLRDAPTSTKDSVREMCGRISEVSPQFLSKVIPVTLASS
jgi:Immunity protein 30